MHGEAGKGDKPRPKSISDDEYRRRFDEAFGNRKEWWETEEHEQWVKESQQIRQESETRNECGARKGSKRRQVRSKRIRLVESNDTQ